MNADPMNAGPRPAGKSILGYLERQWQRCPLSKRVSTRFLKFLVVGGSGVFVNLLAMALLLRSIGWRDWRVSAIASTIAAVSNYGLNNQWTFRDRRRTGRALSEGVFLYLVMSGVGIAATALIYAGLTRIHFNGSPTTSYVQLMGIQLIAISVGTYLNYALNSSFTWRAPDPPACGGGGLSSAGRILSPVTVDSKEL